MICENCHKVTMYTFNDNYKKVSMCCGAKLYTEPDLTEFIL